MPRPRVHDPDSVLDAVEHLVSRSGPHAVSIRAISSAIGVSNGALYHTFSSRNELMAHAWLRAGRRFLQLQTALVDDALHPQSGTQEAGVDAVVAAADAPIAFAERHPDSAALLLGVRRDELLADPLPETTADALRDLDGELIALMVRLADAMWSRRDAAAVDVITACIVDLPTALVLRRDRLGTPTARARLQAAVRAALTIPPPDHRRKGRP
ncbi:TetR/AcrR family transcriptional regulator [Mycolicibacterium sp. 018/SC-01/001]|uniref:TetR/AcrR family transcriptional regulator n=1 Tax=Mycolicibacterium sp. 018/SC-01/001 TaxID=2592069 RepID=UPI00117CDB48|nr:TetR/AcrR family transcriptional regulator [Mycolicibacterium sp. 018/SC-01/001]TRW80726.1 TetR/AcrR family transcriptional regulator [Mycolicibacterium sp. 018/SC-01/001]